MGTHPIFESDFDCLTKMEQQSSSTFGLKLHRSHSGLSFTGPESPVFLKQPEWRPDRETCEQCDRKFDFFCRRHHCRRCGRCLCERCSRDKGALKRMRFLDLVRQCKQCLNISADENQKLSKISILSQKVDFVDTSEKLCSVSIDEYFTTINCHRPIELANLASARILTKMRQNQKYPIGFCFTTTTSDEQFEFLLPEHSTRSDMIWLKCLRLMFDLIFEQHGTE